MLTRVLPLVAIAALVSLLALGAAALVYRQAYEVETLALNQRLDAHAARLQNHLQARESFVAAMAATFEPADPLDTNALASVDKAFLDTLTDFYSFVWIPVVAPGRAQTALARLEASGVDGAQILGPGRSVIPLHSIDEPLALVFDIRPRSPQNLTSLGLNLEAMPLPAAALANARTLEGPAATAPLELVQAPGHPAVVIYAPVYRADGARRTPVGYLGMSFAYDTMIAAALGPRSDLAFSVRDAHDASGRLLRDDAGGAATRFTRRVDFGGRELEVGYAVAATPGLIALREAFTTGGAALISGLGILFAAGTLARAQKRTEEALAARTEAEARLKLMVDELNHRVRNVLTLVQALVRLGFRGKAPPEVVDSLLNRIRSLAHSTTIAASLDWSGVPMAELARTTLHSLDTRLTASGPDFLLTAQAAQHFGLLLHELWTNATKHGALSGEGQAAARWSLEGEQFIFSWIETGGPPARPPQSQGFGSLLIGTIVPNALGGQAECIYDEDGFRYRLVAPLSGLASAAAG